jgi:hypothetical protein
VSNTSADTFRIVGSTNPPAAIKAALARRGIADYCNALPPRSRSKHVQVFVMADGRVVLADSRVLRDVVQEVRA